MPPTGQSSTAAQIFLVVLIAGIVYLVIKLVNYPSYRMYASTNTGTCTAVNSTLSYKMEWCNCGKRCSSTYPCLHVDVVLDTDPPLPDSPLANGEVLMSNDSLPDPSQAVRLFDSALEVNRRHSNCTYTPSCSRYKQTNEERVLKYQETYGTAGATFICHYLPYNTAKVVRLSVPKSAFVHWFLWPSLAIALSIGVLIYVFKFSSHRDDDVLTIIGIRQWFNNCRGKPNVPPTEQETGTAEEMQKVNAAPESNSCASQPYGFQGQPYPDTTYQPNPQNPGQPQYQPYQPYPPPGQPGNQYGMTYNDPQAYAFSYSPQATPAPQNPPPPYPVNK